MVTKKDKLLAAAQKFLERGNLEKALAEFQKAVVEDPKDTRTWLRIAELHVKRGATDQASDVYLKTAELYVEQGFFQRAVAVYKNVVKLSPNYLEGYFKLAEIYKQLGLLTEAVGQYEQAAAAFQRTGRTKEALSAMRQIVEINPEQVVARIKLAEAASQAGQVADALTEFGVAAQQLQAQGRLDEYLRVAERILFLQPDNLVLAKEMANRYIDRNNARFALAKLQVCFKADARDPETLSLLARAFEQLGQMAKTISVLKELARVHGESGNIPERNQVVQRILALDPNEPEAFEAAQRLSYVGAPPPGLAAAAAGKSPRKPSITFTEMAVPQFLAQPEPNEPPAAEPARNTGERAAIAAGMLEPSAGDIDADVQRIIAEADTFVKYGLVERAADHLRKVFDLAATHVGAHERLAAVLLQLGRTGEAVAELEVLAEQLASTQPEDATTFAQRALDLDPGASRAQKVLEALTGGVPAPITGSGIPILLDEDSSPFLEILETGSIRQVVTEPEAEVDDPEAAFDRVEATVAQDMSAFDRVERTHSDNTTADDSMVEDLDQVDFFLGQDLADDAQALLDDLEARFPGHPLVISRRTRLEAMRNVGIEQGAVPSGAIGGTSYPEKSAPISPRAVVAAGGTADLSTHADLGIGYKEMGLLDAAIKEFAALARDPAREVFALTMLGECYEAKGVLNEAVINYKKALNRSTVTEAEATQLYFHLGSVFQVLGDRKEALYFFEKVAKRDPAFGDTTARVAALRAAGAGAVTPRAPAPDAGPAMDFDTVITGQNRSGR